LKQEQNKLKIGKSETQDFKIKL